MGGIGSPGGGALYNAGPRYMTPGAPGVPFLQRTPSGQIHLTNASNVTISGKQFVNIAADAVILENCNNVTVTQCDFSGDVGGVYALNSTNVTVTYNRFSNIGDGTIGSGHSNYVQFNACVGGYIAYNKGRDGNTEDMISLFGSNGASAASPIIVEFNAFQSTTWVSGSGSGTMAGDGGGSHIVVQHNTYLNPAQVGIGVPGGFDIHILNNTIYGAQQAKSNVGLYVWNQGVAGTCSNIEVSGNRSWWLNAAGAASPSWNAGNCGAVAGWSANVWQDATIDPAALVVTL